MNSYDHITLKYYLRNRFQLELKNCPLYPKTNEIHEREAKHILEQEVKEANITHKEITFFAGDVLKDQKQRYACQRH